MRTFQFLTFSEVSPKIGPSSLLELSINLIEAPSTDKIKFDSKLVNFFAERPRLNFGEIG